MKEHCNLFYLFLEDQAAHALSAQKSEAIRKNIEKFYKGIKPPWPATSSESKSGP